MPRDVREILIKWLNIIVGHLTKPFQIIKQSFSTDSSKGEVTVHVNINLSLTLDKEGNVTASTVEQKNIEKDVFIIPDFEAEKLIENFGEEV